MEREADAGYWEVSIGGVEWWGWYTWVQKLRGAVTLTELFPFYTFKLDCELVQVE